MTDNAFAKLSVLLEFKSDLFSEIAESSLSFISNIFSFPVKGNFIVVSIPSSDNSFFIAKDIKILFLE